MYKLDVKEPHIISLIILSAFASMGALVMTPALPQIAHFFAIPMHKTQLTVTSFLFGYALGQLIYGPLANRFGRKKALYIGISVATLGSLFSVLSSPYESFHLLILGRIFEAFGSSVGLVVCFTIINDYYYIEQSRKIVAFMMLAFAIIPGIAVAIGGLLVQFINWQSCFYFLLLYGIVLIYPAMKLPETVGKVDHKALHVSSLFNNYLSAAKNKKLIGYSLVFGLSTSCGYVFGAQGPFIGIHTLHVSPGVYGLLGLLPYIGAVIGCITTIRVSHKINARAMVTIGIICEVIAAIAMMICFVTGLVNMFTLLAPMVLLLVGHAIISSNSASLAMSDVTDKANASAVMNFTNMGTAVIMTILLGVIHTSVIWLMPLIFICALAFMIMTFFYLKYV